MKDTHRIVHKLDGKEEKDREKFIVYDNSKIKHFVSLFTLHLGEERVISATFYSRSFTGL